MNCLFKFQPQQILCLPDGADRLYVEVIQVVVVRQMCWVRPLALVIVNSTGEQSSYEADSRIYDLCQSADLLWSASCFRVALDTEVIPVLAQLGEKVHPSDRPARQQLQDFMQRVWQTHHCEASA